MEKREKNKGKGISRRSFLKGAAVAGVAAALSTGPFISTARAEVTLRTSWWAWEPSALLEELFPEFTKETGIKIIGDWVPFAQLHDKVAVAMAAKDPSIDMPVCDSQWMGEMVKGGHIVLLNDWMAKPGTIVKVSSFYPNIASFIGEYPIGSKKQYGLPVINDGQHLVYRKDLFEDPKEKEAFKKKYGRELGVPKTWYELRDIAEFFTRPNQNLYGLACYYSQSDDTVSTMWDQILWSWGGDLWNPKTNQVEGYVNSKAAVESLEFFVGLKKFCPPGAENYGFEEVKNAMAQGIVAMDIIWFAFNSAFIDPKASKVVDKVAFATLPAGPKGRYVSLGGQAITISKYSKNKDACFKFLNWLYREDTQKKFAMKGAPTALRKVLDGPDFPKIRPWNKVILESIPLMKDFWNVTCYGEMLDDEQKLLNAAATGSMTPKAALDEMAKRHTAAMKKAGYLK